MKKGGIGDRMKEFYEKRTRTYLPRRTYSILRLDGKAFHTYTKGLVRPFDLQFVDDMDEVAKYLCKEIQGAKCAYVQSDEISILITDFDNLQTSAWFDGNIQKMVSVSAGMASAKLSKLRSKIDKLAIFDSRVFTIPSITDVHNYFVWRQQDCILNSISSVAQSLYSHKELFKKNSNDMQEMIFQKGINWNDYDSKLKRGRMIIKDTYEVEDTIRSKWVSIAPPDFTKEKTYITYDILKDLNKLLEIKD